MTEFLRYLSELRVVEEKGLAFVAMPFTPALEGRFRNVIEAALVQEGMRAQRADGIYTSASIMENVLSLLRRSEVVIADVTGRNPNVLYELGMASTLAKRVVLLSSSVEDIPLDLRPFPHVVLGDGPSEDRELVRKAVRDVRGTGQRERVTTAALRLLDMCDSLGIEDSERADQELLFELVLGAKHSVHAVGLTGRSIFGTDARDLRVVVESLQGVETRIFLSAPNSDASTFAESVEQTGAGAASLQVVLSTKRFQALGLTVNWVAMPLPIGGVLVDGCVGLFQFFFPGHWHTQFVLVRDKPSGMLSALRTLFEVYRAHSTEAPRDLT